MTNRLRNKNQKKQKKKVFFSTFSNFYLENDAFYEKCTTDRFCLNYNRFVRVFEQIDSSDLPNQKNEIIGHPVHKAKPKIVY